MGMRKDRSEIVGLPPCRVGNGGNSSFVQALFRDTAARPATPAEVGELSAMLADGTREPVVRSVIFSEDSMTCLAQRLQRQFLGRSADEAELAHWIGCLRSGQPLDKVIARLIESDDYAAHATERSLGVGPDSHFVQAIHADLLHRRATSAELGMGLHKLWESGRGQVVLPILRSVEYRTSYVVETYAELLQRPASAHEISPWISWGNSAVDLLQIRIGLLSSDEYFNRWK